MPNFLTHCRKLTIDVINICFPRCFSCKKSKTADAINAIPSSNPTPKCFWLRSILNVHVDTPSDTFPSSFLNLLSSVNLVQHVTSQLILRITPLTFSSHPLHLSFLLRYHALLSISLIIILIMADLEIKPFVRPPLQHTLIV